MNKREEITLVDLKPSWRGRLATAINVLSIAAVIGLGVVLNSAAMQWAGFAFAALMICGVAARRHRRGLGIMTPQEAADYLHDRYKVVGGGRIVGSTGLMMTTDKPTLQEYRDMVNTDSVKA